MREDGRESGNVEDRRGGGGIAGIGVGGLVIIVIIGVVYALVTHKNPQEIMAQLAQVAAATQRSRTTERPKDAQGKFAAVVLGSTEDVWSARFKAKGQTYEPPTLVLYDQATFGGCGLGAEAMGPFYCAVDRKVYLDLQFFQELEQKFGAKGDFARAYVIAHEVGHHVQNLEGLTGRIERAEQAASRNDRQQDRGEPDLRAHGTAEPTASPVSGAKDYVKSGSLLSAPPTIDSALVRRRAAVGDDTIEKKTQGAVVPDSFTPRHVRTALKPTGSRSKKLPRCRATRKPATPSRPPA